MAVQNVSMAFSKISRNCVTKVAQNSHLGKELLNNFKFRIPSYSYYAARRTFADKKKDKNSQQWVTIRFMLSDGESFTRRAKVGERLQDFMCGEEFENRGIGACGGTISCSTCHMILSPEDYKKLGNPECEEEDLLNYAPDKCETSRLACGIEIASWMEGLVVNIPSKVRDQREELDSDVS